MVVALTYLSLWLQAKLHWNREEGQGTVEYALVIGVGVVLAIGALTAASPSLGDVITDALQQAKDALNLPAPG